MKQPILNGILESPLDLNGFGFVNVGGLLGTFQSHSAVLDTLAATSPSSAGLQLLQFAAPGVDSLIGMHSNGVPYYTAGSALGDVTSTESVSVDGQIALFNGTSGKQIRKATATGIAKLAGGVLGTVAAPIGNLVGHDDTQTLYNKTLVFTSVADVGLNFTRPAGAGTIQLLAQGGASNLAVYLPAVSGTLITGTEAAAAYVPASRTVNGHALSNNVTVTPTDLGLVIGTNVQAYDSDLTTWAGLTPSANAQSLVTAADYAAMKTLLGLVIGTNVQAYNANLTTWASLPPSTVGSALVQISSPGGTGFIKIFDDIVQFRTAAQFTSDLSLTVGTNVQAWNTNLDTWATKTPYAGSLTITTGKTFNVTGTLTLAGTDGSTLNIGTGGTLGSNAFTSTAYAPLASPALTGVPTAPTASGGTNTTQIATTAFVTSVVSAGGAPFVDSTAIIKGSGDATKLLRFEIDGFTTGTTRVLTPPNYDGTIATLAGAETLTNKKLGSLTSAGVTNPGYVRAVGSDGTLSVDLGLTFLSLVNSGDFSVALTITGSTALTLPTSGTLLSTAALGTGVGTALAINVGSAGAFVTFNGALGTPSSGTLTNATGLPIAGINFLDTDGTLAANSDAKVPSQKAVKTYVDANAGGVIGTAQFSITDNLGDPVIALDSATGIFAGATAGFSGGNFTVTYSASHPEAIVSVRSFDAPDTAYWSIHTLPQTDEQFVVLFNDISGATGATPLAHPFLTSVSLVAISE